MATSYPQLVQLVASYRWQRGWHYWHSGRQRAALGQWRRLPQALGWSNGETYAQLGYELQHTVGQDAADVCLQWGPQRGWRSPPPSPPSSETPTPPETSPTADAKQETAPEDSTDWLALGDLHRENKDFLQASEAYFKAVEGSDKKTVSRSWLRLLHLPVSESMVASVAERYADLAKRYPTDYRPVTNLGRLFSFHQQPDKAIAAHREGSRRRTQEIHKGELPPDWDDNSTVPPHYIIIGAQKCGTSSLNSHLSKHPTVLPSIIKETYFFTEPAFYSYGPRWYLSHFPRLKSDTRFITGEASPRYLHHPKVPERMVQLFPTIKLIVLLRSPSDRFISQYHHWRSRGYESRSLEEVVRISLEHWKDVPPERVQKNQEHFSLKYYPDDPNDDPSYFYRGIYAHHLKRWLEYFPREQLLVLTLDEMIQEPNTTFNRVCDFLGIPNCDLKEYRAVNQGQYSTNSTQDQCREVLAEAFAPHDQQLEALLQRPLPWR